MTVTPKNGIYDAISLTIKEGNGSKTIIITVYVKQYVQNGLLLHYDAINNTGNGHSSTATIWEDLSGNNNDGVIHGASINDNYISFDGTDDYIDANKIGLQNDESFTFETTMYFIDSQKAKCLISMHINTPGGAALGIDDSTQNYLKFHINNYGTQRINSSKALNDGKKHHIVGTYVKEESKLYLYIDGELNQSAVVPAGLTYPDLNLNIGRWVGGQTQYFKGNIYSVRIYNRALNILDVKQNYALDKEKYTF